MYRMLIFLMVASALPAVDLSWKDVRDCRGRECAMKFARASQKVLRIDWKPVSVWPEEAKRFN